MNTKTSPPPCARTSQGGAIKRTESCCNHDCGEGRSCPNRPKKTSFLQDAATFLALTFAGWVMGDPRDN